MSITDENPWYKWHRHGGGEFYYAEALARHRKRRVLEFVLTIIALCMGIFLIVYAIYLSTGPRAVEADTVETPSQFAR